MVSLKACKRRVRIYALKFPHTCIVIPVSYISTLSHRHSLTPPTYIAVVPFITTSCIRQFLESIGAVSSRQVLWWARTWFSRGDSLVILGANGRGSICFFCSAGVHLNLNAKLTITTSWTWQHEQRQVLCLKLNMAEFIGGGGGGREGGLIQYATLACIWQKKVIFVVGPRHPPKAG